MQNNRKMCGSEGLKLMVDCLALYRAVADLRFSQPENRTCTNLAVGNACSTCSTVLLILHSAGAADAACSDAHLACICMNRTLRIMLPELMVTGTRSLTVWQCAKDRYATKILPGYCPRSGGGQILCYCKISVS